MSDITVRVENLGKSYIIGHEKQQNYTTIRDVLAYKAKQLGAKTRQIFHGGQLIAGNELEEFWALKDVNFEINQGDRLGIIGRNGAGKSTLLKLLSRITEPSTGKISLKGRVASLLEVGTGFHPELTGRENIYLNGAILGMTRTEIKRNFDEIVAFAEVDKFLDTPVKRYSSGMYVRLAFAVAAHLDTEVLIVDEVLAVGDSEFQKKCLGKMGEVSNKGRTVLFVSHNMSAIQRLCERCILINNGLVAFDGEVNSAVDRYLKHKNTNQQISWLEEDAPGNEVVRLCAVRFVNHGQSFQSQFDVRDQIVLKVEFHVKKKSQISVLVQFHGSQDNFIMQSIDNYTDGPWGKQQPYDVGTYISACYIPADFLNEGQLSINLWIFTPPLAPHQSPHVSLLNFLSIDITDRRDILGVRGSFPYEWGTGPAVRPKLKWTTEKITQSNDNG